LPLGTRAFHLPIRSGRRSKAPTLILPFVLIIFIFANYELASPIDSNTRAAAPLPVIYQTAIDVPRSWKVVERLQDGFTPLVRLSDLVERLAQWHANLREALFDLYDIYEERRRAGE
jgi:hypothetical protein